MPNKTEEVGDFQLTKRQGRQRRKQTIWTREKISKLIELYRSSDCLWNHYSDLYKNKDCRTKAIDSICTGLGITKNDYGKKIHNLRNQYNSELKKLERRLEVSGSSSAEKTCRWEHFKSLMFLRSVIEPRPGYQQSPQCKKLITKVDFSYAEQEVSKQSQSSIENLELIMENEAEVVEQPKFSEPIPMPTEPAPSFKLSAPSRLAETPTISAPVHIPPSGRDQWDAFGELIASEFRNLNSEISRKRLKRKIMQVMLEVGEEDDLEYPSTNS